MTARPHVLVLGGTGFIGQAVLEALRQDATYTFDWTARIGSPPLFETADLPKPILIDDLEALDLERLKEVDIIVDLVSRGRGRLATQRDILGRIRAHGRLIDELANRNWTGHYVYLSSAGTIYGVAPPPVCTETTPVAPFSDYALEKSFIEMHLQSVAWQTRMRLSVLRVANAYGERQPAKPGFGVIPAILSAVKNDVPFKLYGDGTSRRDYVHVDDIVSAVLLSAASDGAGTINIGSGTGLSVRDILGLVETMTGRSIALEPVPVVAAEPHSVVLDTRRAADTLGWTAQVPFEDGIRRVLAQHALL